MTKVVLGEAQEEGRLFEKQAELMEDQYLRFEDLRKRLGRCWQGMAAKACQIECHDISEEMETAVREINKLMHLCSDNRYPVYSDEAESEILPENLLI
jgi:uncharacterized protein YukE